MVDRGPGEAWELNRVLRDAKLGRLCNTKDDKGNRFDLARPPRSSSRRRMAMMGNSRDNSLTLPT